MSQTPFELLEQNVRWSNLRSVGNSPYVRAASVVPFLGYAILLNEALAPYINLWGGLSVSWRSLFLYFGLSMVGVASMIYAVACRDEVKRYATGALYAQGEDRFFLAGNNFQYLQEAVKNRLDELPPWQRNIPGLKDPDLINDFLSREEQVIPLLSARWQIFDSDNLKTRFIAASLYGIGFFLAAIPTLITFMQVVGLTASYLLS